VQIVLFNVAEEIGFTGFLQARWQDRYGPLQASAMVTIPFALYHLPDRFVSEGLTDALVILPFLAGLHFFARVVFMWLYNSTGRSVLLVGLFHAGFNATVAAGREFIPQAPAAGFWLATGVVAATAVLLVALTKGRLAYRPERAGLAEAPR
jgi:membrane protease YdiL (CAAX protease family)